MDVQNRQNMALSQSLASLNFMTMIAIILVAIQIMILYVFWNMNTNNCKEIDVYSTTPHPSPIYISDAEDKNAYALQVYKEGNTANDLVEIRGSPSPWKWTNSVIALPPVQNIAYTPRLSNIILQKINLMWDKVEKDPAD